MLVRVALILLLLSGLFVAGHLGVNLPWDHAATTPEPDKPHATDASKPPQHAAVGPAQSAIEDTAAALDGTAQPVPSGNVTIDISRISPDGLSVFAGRAEPDTYVTVLENGKPAGTVKADDNGEWSLATEHKFASNDPTLTYQVSKTPPASLEPQKPEPKVAARAAEPAQQSAAAVAQEVMRKFENLVTQAREEAKKYEEAKKKDADNETLATAKSEPELKVEPEAKSEPQIESKETATAEASPNATYQTAPATGEKSSDTSGASVVTAASDTTSPTSVKSHDVIPVPIMFVYNQATLTSEGERAASLLLEYLTLKHLSAVELTGHADERGTNEYNFDLSRERLETVSQLLKQGGYTGELKLTPKGKSEPYTGVDRSRYTGEALFQLDRRVELRVNH